jgi:phosphoribosylglycinamide formyltransferase-1
MGAALRLAVLASGRGSNLQALLDATAAGRLPAEVVGVFSDRPRSGAVQRARAAGVAAVAIRPADFATREAFDESLFSHVEAVHPDLIVCAGYMRLLGAAQVDRWLGRMINIHPSLLPLFKGLRTHEQALAAGVAEHGASTHFVTCELDGGPVIAQARVPVLPGDDASTLSARVLACEHPLLLGTVRLVAAGRVALVNGRVHLDGLPVHAPLSLDTRTQELAA